MRPQLAHLAFTARCVIALWLACSAARADGRPRVWVAYSEAHTPELRAEQEALLARIHCELAAMGLDVSSAASTDPGELSASAERAGAAGALVLERTHDSWLVHLYGRDTEQVERHELSASQWRERSVLAIHVVELLRARLVSAPEVSQESSARVSVQEARADPPRAPEPPPAVTGERPPTLRLDGPVVAPEPRRRTERLSAELGPGVLVSPGPSSAQALLHVALAGRLTQLLSVESLALVPLSTMRYEGARSHAHARTSLVAAGLRIALLERDGFRVAFSAGAALTVFRYRTRGSESAAGRTVTVCPYLRLGASWRWQRELGLRADVLVGSTVDPLRIPTAGGTSSSWGRLWIGVALGFDVALL